MAKKREFFESGNRARTTVKIESVMARRPFSLGYKDAFEGKPFRKEYDSMDVNSQWNYERGRQFFVLYREPTFKTQTVGRGNKKLLPSAVEVYGGAVITKAIV